MASPSWYGLSNRYLEPTTIFSWYPHPLFPYSEFGIILFWESIELLYIHSIAQYWSLSKVFMYTIVTPNLCVLPNRFLEHATIFDCYPHPLFPYSIKLVMIQFWEIFELLCINITQYSRQTKVFKYTIVTRSWCVLPKRYLYHATILYCHLHPVFPILILLLSYDYWMIVHNWNSVLDSKQSVEAGYSSTKLICSPQ
jgi:hypothetical protein